MDSDHSIYLEGTLRWFVHHLLHTDSMRNNVVPNLEANDTLFDLNNFTCQVAAHTEWIFDPGKQVIANDLFEPVKPG